MRLQCLLIWVISSSFFHHIADSELHSIMRYPYRYYLPWTLIDRDLVLSFFFSYFTVLSCLSCESIYDCFLIIEHNDLFRESTMSIIRLVIRSVVIWRLRNWFVYWWRNDVCNWDDGLCKCRCPSKCTVLERVCTYYKLTFLLFLSSSFFFLSGILFPSTTRKES